MAKVSVIVAAYNVEDYIEACLSSALSQTMDDIEVVVVNDASTDKTAEIIDRFVKLDSRVKVVTHTENKSLMQARKSGFRACTGDYILWLDGDDLLSNDACEKAWKAIEKEDVDILQFGFKLCSDDEQKNAQIMENLQRTIRHIPHRVVTASSAGLLSYEAADGDIPRNVWNKIYSREIVAKVVENMPDTYLNMAEDTLFSDLALYFAHTYQYIPDQLYQYRVGSGMSTEMDRPSRKKLASVAKMLFVRQYLHNWLEKRGDLKLCKKEMDHLQDFWLDGIIWNFLTICHKDDREYFLKEILQYCTMEEFLAYMSYMMYGRHIIDPTVAVEACKDLPCLHTEKREVKTVGSYYFRAYNGGMENVNSKLMDIWVRKGYNVVLFTDEEPNPKDYPLNPAIKRVVIPAVKQCNFKSFLQRVTLWKKYIEEYHVDVMVYHAWIREYMVADELAIKNAGAALIAHTHSMFCIDYEAPASYAYTNAQLSVYYQLADMVVTLSDVDKAWWDHCGLPCIKTVNPVGMKLSTKPAALNGHKLLFVGRVSYEKQVVDLLEIVKRVRKKVPDATLTIVGEADDKSYEKTVKAYIKDNQLDDVVEMVGFSQNVQPYYQQSDVMLCTSKFEGFCLTIAESKICGLPLVTYELPNLDFIREHKGMFVVPQNDTEKAAEYVVQLLTNENLKQSMGAEARKSAEELFSLDLGEHWKKIFDRVSQEKPEAKMLSERTPMETAVGLCVEYTARGILKRGDGGGVSWEQLTAAQLECNALDATIKEIRSSTSYRVGMMITAIPRKIKGLFIRKKK